MLHKVEEAEEQIGVHINEGKTEFMSYNEEGKVFLERITTSSKSMISNIWALG